jgi:hypothetical protein
VSSPDPQPAHATVPIAARTPTTTARFETIDGVEDDERGDGAKREARRDIMIGDLQEAATGA